MRSPWTMLATFGILARPWLAHSRQSGKPSGIYRFSCKEMIEAARSVRECCRCVQNFRQTEAVRDLRRVSGT